MCQSAEHVLPGLQRSQDRADAMNTLVEVDPMQGYLQRAAQTAEEGLEFDREGEAERAISSYNEAAGYLRVCLSLHENTTSGLLLQNWIDTYELRASQLCPKDLTATESTLISAVNPEHTAQMEPIVADALFDPSQEDTSHSWDNIAGMQEAKEALYEAVVMPIRHPNLLPGGRSLWSGVLLYGPPGTGKTTLVKALAQHVNVKCLIVSSSVLLSKWLGDSEKAVSAIFRFAKKNSPCLVFFDEVDALCSARGGGADGTGGEHTDGESEAARRLKTELLIHLQHDALDGVVVIAATNRPWDMDSAFRRRFQRRIYTPLLDEDGRRTVLLDYMAALQEQQSSATTLSDERFQHVPINIDIDFVVSRTEGYTGSDLMVFIRELFMVPVRKIYKATAFHLLYRERFEEDDQSEQAVALAPVTESFSQDEYILQFAAHGMRYIFDKTIHQSFTKILEDRHRLGTILRSDNEATSKEALEVLVPPIQPADVDRCLARIRPTVSNTELERLQEYKSQYGELSVD